VKPFRGKPEKAESSKAEIQLLTEDALNFCGRIQVGQFILYDSATRGREMRHGACTSPLVGRRDSLGDDQRHVR
jgi:hypothetical protein